MRERHIPDDKSLSSLGLEAGVDVGSLVVDDGEEEVGADQAESLVVGGGVIDEAHQLGLEVLVHLGQGVLSEELAEDLLGGVGNGVRVAVEGASHLEVKNEGTNLRAQVGNSAGCESGVGETVIKGEEELSCSAVLELSHELDTHVLEGVGHVIVVSEVNSVEERLDLGLGSQARLVAGSLLVFLVVLEGQAETLVQVSEGLAEAGQRACNCVPNESESHEELIHHLCSNLFLIIITYYYSHLI